jgi:hypothetical protein
MISLEGNNTLDVGDKIVITSSGWDASEAERREIVDVLKDGYRLDERVKNLHQVGKTDIIPLKKNIVIQGGPNSTLS